MAYGDRLKDSIRRRAENVSSWEIESVLNAFPSVVESAAYGVSSELGEDDVIVAIVWDSSTSVDLDALIAHCERQLTRFAMPRYVRVCEELPKTLTQRVQKFRLREEGVTPGTLDRGDRVGGAGFHARPYIPSDVS